MPPRSSSSVVPVNIYNKCTIRSRLPTVTQFATFAQMMQINGATTATHQVSVAISWCSYAHAINRGGGGGGTQVASTPPPPFAQCGHKNQKCPCRDIEQCTHVCVKVLVRWAKG